MNKEAFRFTYKSEKGLRTWHGVRVLNENGKIEMAVTVAAKELGQKGRSAFIVFHTSPDSPITGRITSITHECPILKGPCVNEVMAVPGLTHRSVADVCEKLKEVADEGLSARNDYMVRQSKTKV